MFGEMRSRLVWFAGLAALVLPFPVLSGPAAAEALNPQQQLAFDIYKELVEIDTTTATGDTKQAAEAMAARLKVAGLAEADIQVFSPAPPKGNLVPGRRGRQKADPAIGASRRRAGQPRGLDGRSVQADREGRLLLCARQRRRQIHGGGVCHQSDPLQAGGLQAPPTTYRPAA